MHGWFGSSRGWGSLPDYLDLIDFSGGPAGTTSTPVKLIVGVNDPALSADVMEQTWLVFFPEAEMTILPDAGHYPMFESPVSLATSIEEFLGRE